MVEFQTSLNFTLHMEGDQLVLTIYNRPSYGEEEIRNILGADIPDVEVVSTDRQPGNVFILSLRGGSSPKGLRATRQAVKTALESIHGERPEFEPAHEPRTITWGPSTHAALAV